MQRVRTHLAGNAVAYLALFVALGGTSYAAAELAPNSVGTAQLRNGAVTGSKVRNGSLQLRDFAPGQLRIAVKTAKGPAGAAGPKGPAGPQGPQGPAGPSGATKVATRAASGSVGADGRYTATAVCAAGERAVGGGAVLIGSAHSGDHLLSSRPGVTTTGGFGQSSNLPSAGDTPNAWTAEMYSAVGGRTLNVYVICAAP